ncbi:hypothetical protein BC829DRAFT_401034 [Chytridium lagenaria]|nr:hypothetical protein BC829DRAFT_401034 [Chytridium lagenaria]
MILTPQGVALQTSRLKGKKAKKSIAALILASGAASSIAFPSFFFTISTLRPSTKPSTRPSTSSTPSSQPPSRRAFSTAIIPHHSFADLSPTSPTPLQDRSSRHPIHPTPRQLGVQRPQPQEDDEDWDKEFNLPTSTPTLHLRRAPHSQSLSRRIQSAPSVALRKFGEGAGGGMVDALMEDDFLVSSVREKAERRRLRELERSVSANGGLESWDDDFGEAEVCGRDGGEWRREWEELSIPKSVYEAQEALRMDAMHMKEFALHIEDLKLVYLDAIDMAQGLSTSPHLPPTHHDTLATLRETFTQDLSQIEVLIDLGESSETSPNASERHLRILGDLLDEDVREFGVSLIPTLIKRIGPLKKRNIARNVT